MTIFAEVTENECINYTVVCKLKRQLFIFQITPSKIDLFL